MTGEGFSSGSRMHLRSWERVSLPCPSKKFNLEKRGENLSNKVVLIPLNLWLAEEGSEWVL
jgi:hypothetical protein